MPDPVRPAELRAPDRASGGATSRARHPLSRHWLGRLGFSPQRASRSIWFHGSRPGADDALFRDVLRDRSDVALAITAGDRRTTGELRARHPDDIVAPMPVRAGIARFVAGLRPCALVLLPGAEPPSRPLLDRVRTAGVPVVDLRGVRHDASVVAKLRALLPPPAARATDAPPTWRLPTVRDRAGQSAAWKAVAPIFMRRRIDDWDALRHRLAQPRSILCLGNGPSSEDPRLARVEHDCLFRMNWRWIERGFLARPDVVFVGTPDTLGRVPRSIFGFWSVRLEYAMLLRRLASRGPTPIDYFTVERLSPLAAESRWPARPTNGALAIVAAAALAPERIVIGGYDLFAHPAGRYPGDARTRNDYASPHRLDVELDLIALALRDFRGEVIVLSDLLRDELERRRERLRHAA